MLDLLKRRGVGVASPSSFLHLWPTPCVQNDERV